ncbi:hypothetical protein U91I_01162 [alpha proteobacterium U9-1i]|nr:hypothetical protein U91I_01162 [alpha proteobacterium U9-1i]
MKAARFVAAALALAVASCTPTTSAINEQWSNIAVTAAPATLGVEQVGVLRFRGGLALSAAAESGFGGWSDLEVLDDGRLIAISDDGKWLSARLVLDESGSLTGLTDTRIALMRDENGAPFPDKDSADAEDLAQLPDGRFAVSFEQTHEIRIYDFNRDGPFGAATRGPALAGVAALPSNSSLEAMATTSNGTLIVGAEDAGHLWRVRLGQNGIPSPVARYPLATGYSLTSLDRLPNGDFVALERFYAPAVGSRARLTTIHARDIRSNQQTAKTELALFTEPLALDNFEGVAAVRLPSGGVRLYILSDDNFSTRQRTLLYAFDVVEGGSWGPARER